jgi:hypothetical protein
MDLDSAKARTEGGGNGKDHIDGPGWTSTQPRLGRREEAMARMRGREPNGRREASAYRGASSGEGRPDR